MFYIVVCLVIGYFCGCISTGYMVGKANKIDIRQYGSGNSGTTNALRTLGMKAGIITFLGDALKAVIPILFVRYVFHVPNMTNQLLTLYTGLGVVLGHNFPFWLKFKGGKGIAATAGVMVAFDIRFGLTAMLIFIIVVAVTRYVSLGSLILSLVFPVGVFVFYRTSPDYLHMLIVSLIFTLLAFIKHHGNIKRLFNGTENKLGQKIKVDK